jgi:hypothetical protein
MFTISKSSNRDRKNKSRNCLVCSVLFSYDEGATTKKIEYKRIEGGKERKRKLIEQRKRNKMMTNSKFHYINFN